MSESSQLNIKIPIFATEFTNELKFSNSEINYKTLIDYIKDAFRHYNANTNNKIIHEYKNSTGKKIIEKIDTIDDPLGKSEGIVVQVTTRKDFKDLEVDDNKNVTTVEDQHWIREKHQFFYIVPHINIRNNKSYYRFIFFFYIDPRKDNPQDLTQTFKKIIDRIFNHKITAKKLPNIIKQIIASGEIFKSVEISFNFDTLASNKKDYYSHQYLLSSQNSIRTVRSYKSIPHDSIPKLIKDTKPPEFIQNFINKPTDKYTRTIVAKTQGKTFKIEEEYMQEFDEAIKSACSSSFNPCYPINEDEFKNKELLYSPDFVYKVFNNIATAYSLF